MILFADGFDQIYDDNSLTNKWDYKGHASMNYPSDKGVNGARALNPTRDGQGDIGTSKNLSALAAAGAGNYIYAGFWFQPVDLPTNATDGDVFCFANAPITEDNFGSQKINWSNSDSTQTAIRLVLKNGTSNVFYLARGSTTLATGTTVIKKNTWYWIELKVCIDNTSGVAELRIDEAVDATFSGDTYNAGAIGINSFAYMTCYNATGTSHFDDDLVINDSTGSQNNGYLGRTMIETKYTSGAGSTTQGTPSSGANYSCVNDENGEDGDSSYVDIGTVGNKDTYTFDALSSSFTTVHGVVVNTNCRATGTTVRKTKGQVKSGSSSAQLSEGTAPFGTTYKTLQSVSETDPATSTLWTESGVNAAEFGFSMSA